MDPAIIGVAGTLLGGLVGGLFGHWTATAQARLAMDWEQAQLTQEKLEEIALILDSIEHHYAKLLGDLILKVELDTPYPRGGERLPIARLRILTEFYAPDMLSNFEELEKRREEFGSILADALIEKVRTKPEKQQINGRAVTAQGRIVETCAAMSSKAASRARQLVLENDAVKKAAHK